MNTIPDRRRGYILYSMTNAADLNEIVAVKVDPRGGCTCIGSYKTGGKGTGAKTVDPLMSQGSVILSDDGCFLFAVNAGSNSITSFSIADSGELLHADVKPSGGYCPVSLTAHRDLLFVANRGGGNDIASNIAGFRVGENGELTKIPGSIKPLGSADAQPACIVLNHSGDTLAVTERNTNRISVYAVQPDGTTTGPAVNKSCGAGPFGSAFLRDGILLVAEAGANALSSYTVERRETLCTVSGSVPNFQTATCWVVPSHSGCSAYTSNTGSHTVTTYQIECLGHLRLLDVIYSTGNGSGAPIDNAVSDDGLYMLNGNEGSFSIFRKCRMDRLFRSQVIGNTELPEKGAQGLAVLCLPRPHHR